MWMQGAKRSYMALPWMTTTDPLSPLPPAIAKLKNEKVEKDRMGASPRYFPPAGFYGKKNKHSRLRPRLIPQSRPQFAIGVGVRV